MLISRSGVIWCLCVICNVLEHALRGKKLTHVDILRRETCQPSWCCWTANVACSLCSPTRTPPDKKSSGWESLLSGVIMSGQLCMTLSRFPVLTVETGCQSPQQCSVCTSCTAPVPPWSPAWQDVSQNVSDGSDLPPRARLPHRPPGACGRGQEECKGEEQSEDRQ